MKQISLQTMIKQDSSTHRKRINNGRETDPAGLAQALAPQNQYVQLDVMIMFASMFNLICMQTELCC